MIGADEQLHGIAVAVVVIIGVAGVQDGVAVGVAGRGKRGGAVDRGIDEAIVVGDGHRHVRGNAAAAAREDDLKLLDRSGASDEGIAHLEVPGGGG